MSRGTEGAGRGAVRRADGGWGAGKSSAWPAARAWARRGSGFRTKALALRVQHRPYMQPAWPPRPAPPRLARHGAHSRGLHCTLRPPPLAAALSRWRDLGRPAQGLPPACGRADPALRCFSGRKGVGGTHFWLCFRPLARTAPPPPTRFPTAGLTRARFPWNALSSENNNIGQHDGRCVPGARHRSRVPAHLRTSSENGAGPAPWSPGRRCQREVGSARSRRQRAAEAPPAEPGPGSSELGAGIREAGASGPRAPRQASAPFSQPERRWFLAGVSARGCPCRLPVGAWKDQRLAFQ